MSHICTECNVEFSTKRELTQHIIKCHSNIQPLICDKCGKAFKKIGHLNAHLVAHEKYTCPKCDEIFPTERRIY